MRRIKGYVLSKVISALQIATQRLKTIADAPDRTDNEMLYLAPSVSQSTDDYKYYFQQLDYFINDCASNVTEIALTGPYGSGKSTLLKTYFSKRPNLKTKFVSLGTYLPSKGEKKVEDLEKAIARQLLYQHSGLEEVGSKFSFPIYRKSEKLSSYVQATVLIFWSVFFGYGVSLGLNPSLDKLDRTLLNADWISIDLWLTSFIFSVPICLLADIYKYLSRNRLSSVNPKEGSFDFKPTAQEGTSFSLHLEELLRFFIATKSDVVVIEDLDRYEIPEVFERLKELNNIINQSDQVLNPVRFVYAVRDDIFQGSGRAKFFDAIVPLIPVMSPFNSYERFKQLFTDTALVSQVEPVLRKVSVSVPDMRVLRNIVNEFNSYRKILKTQNCQNNYARLLSFIVYKNLYSHDFAKLYTNETSAIDQAVNVKEKIRRQEEKELSEQYELLIQQDKNSTEELLQNEQEYKWSLFGQLSEALNVDAIIKISGIETKQMTVEQLVKIIDPKSSQWLQLQVISNGNYYTQNYQIHQLKITALDPDVVQKRLNSIRGKSTESSNQRHQQLSKINQKLLETRSLTWPLSEAMELVPDEEWVPHDMPVLKMLLRDGLIDEHYGLYLNHVLEGRLTDRDFAFLQALRDRQEFDLMFESSNYQELLSYLSDDDAHSPASRNYGLLRFLLRSDDHSVLRNKIIRIQFSGHESCSERLYSLRSVLPEWHKLLWDTAITDVSISINSLPKINSIELLSDLVNYLDVLSPEERAFLQLSLKEEPLLLEAISRHPNPGKTMESFKSKGIMISYLVDVPHLRPLIISSIELGIIELNSMTLQSSLSANAERGITLPVTYELIDQFKSVRNFVDSDFAKEVELATIGDIIQCPNSFILRILKSDLSEEITMNALKNIEFVLTTLDNVPQQYWVPLIDNRKVKIDWSVLEALINEQGNSSQMDINWLSELLATKDAKDKLAAEIPNCSPEQNQITRDFLVENIIDIETFSYYAMLLELEFTNEEVLELEQGKITSLIEHGMVTPTLDLFNLLRKSDEDNAIFLIEKHQELINTEGFEIDKDDFSALLPLLNKKYNHILLKGWTEFINDSIPHKYWLSSFMQKIVVENRIDGLVKKTNGTNFSEHLAEIGIQNVIKLNNEQIIEFLESEKMSPNEKLNLIIGQIPHHQDNINILAEQALGQDWPLCVKSHPYSPLVYSLLMVCVEFDLLSSFRISGNEIKINSFRK
ncbi:hypothetical protein AL538_25550 [Vibrio harveyi]|uniref:YobI-like P-loop NTPase domain-containing protein n=1 Tax=Vibrio harveyi TaxID=669 RepID=A0ABM5Y617_VIBHA|nr:P-loop NTPase fold protein [Vibrio harveyi]AMG01026.1 hypothetical protein AL538_25550 [Vibrio harveyi]